MTSHLASLFFIGALLQFVVTAAVDHRVGGDFGWNLPPTSTFFSEWASNKTFFVGDTLRFNSSGRNETHNFAMPESEADFDKCIKPGIVFLTSVYITFVRPGPQYYICNVDNHCNLGMKFSIHVLPKPGTLPPPNAADLKVIGAALPTTLLFTAIIIIANLLFFI